MGFDNFKHFSFSIQEKILLEFKIRLQLARLQGGLIHGLQCRLGLGYEMNDIKGSKFPMMFPQVCITQKSSIGGVFPFLLCHLLTSLHWSLVLTFVFKLIHLESYL